MYFARCKIRSTRPIGRLGIFLSIPASKLCFTKHRTGHRHTDRSRGLRTHECNGRDFFDETRSFLFILVETCKFLRCPLNDLTMQLNNLQADESMPVTFGFLFLVAQFLVSGDHVILDNMVRLAF